MKIITNLRELHRRFRRPVVAIGIFDGIHLGHKRILKRVVEDARRIGGTGVVLTFNPHPRRILDAIGAPPLLVSLRHRLNLIEREGLDVACVLNFNDTFARYEARDFVKRILLNKIGVHTIVVGSNFRFGRDKKGDVALLRKMGRRFGFSVEEMPLFTLASHPASSTRLRALIMRGRLEEASRLMGRPVSILGTVVKGSRRGRLLGYPTANINPHHEAMPPSGVYAVYATFGGAKYRGILNIGTRPTFRKVPQGPYAPVPCGACPKGGRSLPEGDQRPSREKEPTMEVHIFGFNKQIYGKDIEVIFVKKLRDEKRFPDRKELLRQIKIDERRARMVL